MPRPILSPAHAALLKRAFELDDLPKRVPDAALGEKPGTVQFKTPSGHTVTTPYDAQTVTHQVNRLGGKDPYYAKLKEVLRQQGTQTDSRVERERDDAVFEERRANTVGAGFGGGAIGAAAGYGLGHLAGRPGTGALLGGLAGALGGGYLGHGVHVERDSGPTSRKVHEIAELYQEPDHVKETRQSLEDVRAELAAERFQRQMDRHMRGWDSTPYGRYDPFNPYGRRPYYYTSGRGY